MNMYRSAIFQGSQPRTGSLFVKFFSFCTFPESLDNFEQELCQAGIIGGETDC